MNKWYVNIVRNILILAILNINNVIFATYGKKILQKNTKILQEDTTLKITELFLILILYSYHHPSLTHYQHSQSPCWHQLGSAKGYYPNYLQIPNPIIFMVLGEKHPGEKKIPRFKT